MKRFPYGCAIAMLLIAPSSSFGVEDSTAGVDPRYIPNLNVSIRSWDPANVQATYRQYSSGSCSNGGAVGIGIGGAHGFSATVRCLPTRNRIIAEVAIEPNESNQNLVASKSEQDVSDMRADFIEVTESDDGRVYFLIVEPEMIEVRPPRRFSVDELSPFDWDFSQSPVVLNDSLYVGRLGMSGGSLVGMTIAGVDDLEFSLHEIRNAEPIGSLQSGTLTIKSDAYQITVSGVRNGSRKQILEGPYKVWVRSTGNEVSGEEYQRQMASQMKVLQGMKDNGDARITDDVVSKFRGFVEQNRPLLIGSSAREVADDDLVK